MSNRYSLYTASFTASAATTNLRQLREQGTTYNAQRNVVRPGGALDPGAIILSNGRPSMRFATRDLLTVCTNFVHIQNGVYCDGGSVSRYQHREEGGAFKTGANQFQQTTQRGFLHIQSIEVDAESQEGADCNLEYIGLSIDGTTPIVNQSDADFNLIDTPLYTSVYYMGGVQLGGSPLLTLTRARVSPGIRYVSRITDGAVYPRGDVSSINAREPVIELTFLDPKIHVDNIADPFLNALGATLDVFLQRATTAPGGRIAPATTGHIKISAPAGSWGPNDLNARGEEDGTTTIMVNPLTLTMDAAAAIP